MSILREVARQKEAPRVITIDQRRVGSDRFSGRTGNRTVPVGSEETVTCEEVTLFNQCR